MSKFIDDDKLNKLVKLLDARMKNADASLQHAIDDILDMMTVEVVQVHVVDGKLNLVDKRYQKTDMIDGTEIIFPNVDKFTELHLYFTAEENMNISFPDCKWRVEPSIEKGNSYEVIAVYNTIEWLVSVIIYS